MATPGPGSSRAPSRGAASPRRPALLAVVGATATGKSDLALDLARALDGEIVSADALQLYRGMDIGTAKLAPGERAGIPHHLLDVLAVTQEASVSTYQRRAREAIAAIRDRGRLPILVGGSGLYVRAVLDDIAFPPTDPAVRSRLEQQLERHGAAAMHERLAAQDPAAAATIGPGDARRIVRALEVGELTGRPYAAFLPRRHYVEPGTVQIGLSREREELRERVARRVGAMVEQGLLAEIETLCAQGIEEGATARRAIGYEEGLAVLAETLGCEDALERTVTRTRALVRKQDTWFRRDPRVQWIPARPGDGLTQRALRVIADTASLAPGA